MKSKWIKYVIGFVVLLSIIATGISFNIDASIAGDDIIWPVKVTDGDDIIWPHKQIAGDDIIWPRIIKT